MTAWPIAPVTAGPLRSPHRCRANAATASAHLALIVIALLCAAGSALAATDTGLAKAEQDYLKAIASRTDPASIAAFHAVVSAAIAQSPEHAEAIVEDAVTLAPARRDDIVAAASDAYPRYARQFSDVRVRPADAKSPWSGEVDFSAVHASGNSPNDTLGFRGVLKYHVEKWEHEADTQYDFAEDNNDVTTSRLLSTGESKYFFKPKWYAFGSVRFLRDINNGQEWSLTELVGPGHRFVDTDTMTLDVHVGPGLQHIKEKPNQGGNINTDYVSGLVSDFEWTFIEGAKFSNELNVTTDNEETIVDNTTALTFNVIDPFKFRVSYNIRYDTDPDGDDTKKRDTLTRASLVYGF